jgi:hypothetical protein
MRGLLVLVGARLQRFSSRVSDDTIQGTNEDSYQAPGRQPFDQLFHASNGFVQRDLSALPYPSGTVVHCDREK